MVLSELIDFFDIYGMEELKNKYLTEAKALKCTISDRLTATIKSNENVMLGKVMPDYKFANPLNTTAKSLHDVKAKKNLLCFGLPHVLTVKPNYLKLSKIIKHYRQMEFRLSDYL